MPLDKTPCWFCDKPHGGTAHGWCPEWKPFANQVARAYRRIFGEEDAA